MNNNTFGKYQSVSSLNTKQLTSIDEAQNYPHKHPWRKQKDRNQQVKNMVDLLPSLLDHCGLLDSWSTSIYHNYIASRLLLRGAA